MNKTKLSPIDKAIERLSHMSDADQDLANALEIYKEDAAEELEKLHNKLLQTIGSLQNIRAITDGHANRPHVTVHNISNNCLKDIGEIQ